MVSPNVMLAPRWAIVAHYATCLTTCKSWANFLVSSLCVDLIWLFHHDDTLQYLGSLHASLTFFGLQQQQNLGRRSGTSKMHLSCSKAVVLLLIVTPIVVFCNCLCFVVRYFFAIILMGGENWLLCLVCLPGIWWLLGGSFSRSRGFVCSVIVVFLDHTHLLFLIFAKATSRQN